MRAAFSGSLSASQRSFVTVYDATGTEPTASAHHRAPAALSPSPNSTMRSSAAAAERVSFQSSASRTTSPSASRHTMPCCWPATATATTSLRST